ncbi:retrotransposon protein, putative, unclassified [Tanacetum coccineum]
MSMMGELKFFLGIQFHQSPRGIFINQAKYAQEILKKHGMTSCDSISTPMATKPLDVDLRGTPVDQTKYRSMVKALMYLTEQQENAIVELFFVGTEYQLADMFTKALPEDSKQVAGETSSPRKSLKITIKQKKLSSTIIPPPSDDIAKATILSLTLRKPTKIAEEQENVAAIEEKLFEGDVVKIIEGEDEESYAINDDDEEEKKDEQKDDEEDDHNDHALVRNNVTGSSEIRNEKMQTLIPSPPRSPRTDLSSVKTISHELTATVSPTHTTASQDRSKVDKILHEIIPQIASRATNDLIEDNLKASWLILSYKKVILYKLRTFQDSHENNVTIVHPTLTNTTTYADLQHKLYLKMKRNLQDQADDPELWDQEWDSWVEETVIDKDEVIPEDKALDLIKEFQNVDKHVTTIYDHERMEATLRDMMSNQFRDAEEYAYHLQQTKNYMENQMV